MPAHPQPVLHWTLSHLLLLADSTLATPLRKCEASAAAHNTEACKKATWSPLYVAAGMLGAIRCALVIRWLWQKMKSGPRPES